MKKLVLLVLIFALLANSTVTCYASEETTISGETVTAIAGQEVEYRVSIKGNPGLSSFLIKISYDKNIFTLKTLESGEIDCCAGSAFSKGSIIGNRTDSGCQIIWYHTTDISDDGVLFSIRLETREDTALGEYPIKVSCSSLNMTNYVGETIPVSCVNGKVVLRMRQSTIFGESKTVKQGETFDYTIKLQDNPGISSIDLQIIFDSNCFSLVSVNGSYFEKPETEFEQGVYNCKIYTNAAEVFWYHIGDIMDDGAFITLHFSVKEDAPLGDTPVTVQYVKKNTLNAQEKEAVFQCASGVIGVKTRVVIKKELLSTHHIDIFADNIPQGFLIVAFYEENGKMVRAAISQVDSSSCRLSIFDEKFDFAHLDCRIILADTTWTPYPISV